MTVTLTPNGPAATVRVVVTGLPAGTITITRADVNGTAVVLRRTGHTGSGSITVTDTGPARHGLVRYTATAGGASQHADTQLPPADPGPVLHLPVRPHFRVQALALLEASRRVDGGHITHDVIGRPDPVLTLGRARTGGGTFTLRVPDAATADAVADLYARGDVAQLRMADPGAADLFHVADDVQTSPAPPAGPTRRWDVSVSYLSVPAPPGPVAGAYTWTFSDVTDVGSFADVAAGFADFDALAVGT